MAIHSSAVIAPGAQLDSSVEVGAFTVIGPHVQIGAGTRIGPHVVIEGHTTIGRDNQISSSARSAPRPRTRSTPANRPGWKSATAIPSANS